MSDTIPTEKRCYNCGVMKPLDKFNKSKRNKDGRQSQCKVCNREACRTYYAANIDSERERSRSYSCANAQAKSEYNRSHRAANINAYREYDRAYYATNREAIRASGYHRTYQATHQDERRVYCAANAEAIRKKAAAYRASHRDIYRAITQRRRALKKGNGGDGFTASQLKHMRLTQGGVCAYCCYQYHSDTLTADHIIPLAQGGRHEVANICLACEKCNKSKGNRTPDQWVNRWYYHKNE